MCGASSDAASYKLRLRRVEKHRTCRWARQVLLCV